MNNPIQPGKVYEVRGDCRFFEGFRVVVRSTFYDGDGNPIQDFDVCDLNGGGLPQVSAHQLHGPLPGLGQVRKGSVLVDDEGDKIRIVGVCGDAFIAEMESGTTSTWSIRELEFCCYRLLPDAGDGTLPTPTDHA